MTDVYTPEYYKQHRAQIRASHRKYYQNNRELFWEQSRVWAENNPETRKRIAREYARRVREGALKALGGVCSVCGFDDIRALVIHHKNGEGTREYRSIGSHGVYLKVLRGLPGYSALCANCHMIRHSECSGLRKKP